MDCRHHENVHEVILGAPDSGLFHLCNIAYKGFLDILMLGLISAVSLVITTTDKMRCHTKFKFNGAVESSKLQRQSLNP